MEGPNTSLKKVGRGASQQRVRIGLGLLGGQGVPEHQHTVVLVAVTRGGQVPRFPLLTREGAMLHAPDGRAFVNRE